ncbi:hypothetical protein SFLOR_v1c02170 [Spiroplasma floricola 23-6]|uniref:Uncharacterized protein n=2 Tax=Spiroplasma floricola TaxID=216937 RepID=A0A2K8SDH3_9MOLU|nr:hypothetical protein SFLOR_v1c02170 [Spiroplasma floricola 23-6]
MGEKMKNKYTQILIRFKTDEEVELLNKFKAIFKTKSESFNKYIKGIIINIIENNLENKEINKTKNKLKDNFSEILEENIIPRFYGMVKTINEKNLIKIELLNRKVNFLIHELGFKRMIDGRPIINDITEKVKEKNWMLEEELKINDEIQIKKN